MGRIRAQGQTTYKEEMLAKPKLKLYFLHKFVSVWNL